MLAIAGRDKGLPARIHCPSTGRFSSYYPADYRRALYRRRGRTILREDGFFGWGRLILASIRDCFPLKVGQLNRHVDIFLSNVP